MSTRQSSWRRFCNVPPSPVKYVQDTTITSSDESKNRISSDNEEFEPLPLPSPEDDDIQADPDFPSPETEESKSSSEDDEDDKLISCGTTNALLEHETCCYASSSKKIIIHSDITLNKVKSNMDTPNEETKADCSNNFKQEDQNVEHFCFYCETHVQNFARHLKRNHMGEIEVQKAFSLPSKSKLRKEIIASIRKKGNFIHNSERGKPIKKPLVHTKLLPCPHCYGFYSSKTLWRHRKKCTENSDSNHQSAAQNFILRNLMVDSHLRETVFPRMRADEISLVAKKDLIITSFGAQYIKIHREAHYINVASRKMRELARLLIELRKRDSNITNLFDALKPEKYELLIQATKAIANYDETGKFFKSPTLAMNLATSLKQCCDIALLQVYQKKFASSVPSAEIESDLKTLTHLLQSQWKYQISSQAATDLSMNKWNKITLLPLASDIKLLKQFLVSTGNSAEISLKSNGGVKAYLELLETVYCRVILLNRRRPGELQRLLLRTYMTHSSDNNYEEFFDIITPTEKILIKTYKRIVIRGKRGRGVPVLFSPDVQNHLNTLIQYRNEFVRQDNLYLFGNPSTTQPIYGYKTFKKFTEKSGVKNPVALTCTRLRKHMATLAQIFNMSENDLEQLATFMGHTIGIHRQAYRLPDDVYQTAKISKLLMIMESGDVSQFKGKKLDEINLDLEAEPILTNIDDDKNEINNDLEDLNDDENNFKLPEESTERKQKELVIELENITKKKKKRKRNLVPWTDQQKQVVNEFFANHIEQKKPPKRLECENLIKKYPEILNNKNWLKIKVYVQNKYTSKLK